MPVIRDEVQAKPPPGERRRKLLTESGELQAGNDRLLEVWAGHIHEILKECRAPVLVQLEGSLDPKRAATLLAGSTPATTFKRYLTIYKRWRLWL